MDRRGFLKRVGLIPFIGSLFAVAKSETPVGCSQAKLKCNCPAPYIAYVRNENHVQHFRCCVAFRIFNGQVFDSPNGYFTVITQWFDVDKWLLLSEPYLATHGGRAMMFCRYKRKDGSYNPFYTQAELQEKLKNWKLVEDKQLVFGRVIKNIKV